MTSKYHFREVQFFEPEEDFKVCFRQKIESIISLFLSILELEISFWFKKMDFSKMILRSHEDVSL